MEKLNFYHYIAIIPTLLCLFFIILSFLGKKKNQFLAQQLTQTTIVLEATRKKLDAVQEEYERIKEFQNSLDVAALTTKFQKPRLEAQNNDTDTRASGKYSNVQALAEQGMSVEEIASTLSISTHEAHQLVNLSKLAQGNINNNDTD